MSGAHHEAMPTALLAREFCQKAQAEAHLYLWNWESM